MSIPLVRNRGRKRGGAEEVNEPTIVRYVCIRVGRWKLENWHVYQYRQHRDAKTGKNRWMMWDKIF